MRSTVDGGRAAKPRAGAVLLTAALLLAAGTGCAARGGGAGAGPRAADPGARPLAAASGPASGSALAAAAPVAGSPSPSAERTGAGPAAGSRRPRRHPSGPPAPGGSGGSAATGTQGRGEGLDATAQRLAPYLQRRFGAEFAAVLVDDPHGQLVVYRLPDPRLDAAARALAGRTRLAFVAARYSFLQQDLVLARITRDLPYWRGRGIVVNSRGTTNGVHCAVIVTTGTGSAQQQRAFDARYGAGVVKVVEGGAIVYK